ncbi:MAG TPA: methyltransferase domain-containing protein [Gemmataceae bacterium]|nr:methyltransferase domain-containing protein [Gemmataceae bacterium]
MPPASPADWQLPPGVSRGLWDYLHSGDVARGYDAGLAGSTLCAADQAFAERHFDRPGRLLDLGCGTGRLLLPFARRGCWVLGVDLSAEMLKVAEAKAAEAGVVVHLLRANLVELDCLADASFDHAACLFSTLGMVRGADNRRRVLAHAYRLLRPGGRFVLHVHNYWFNGWDRAGRRWLLRDLLARGDGDRPMPPHQGVAGLALHHFRRGEAVRLLRAAGFRLREVRPVGLGPEGRLAWPWWFSRLRAYGYLLAAERPA